MGKYEDTRQMLQQSEQALEAANEELSRLAEEALMGGKRLGSSEMLLAQSKQTEELLLTVESLQKMLDELTPGQEEPEG